MPSVPAIDPTVLERSVDQRVMLWNVSWSDYEAALAMRGESSSPRIAYLKGVLEFMSPSRDHESLKTMIGRLLEAYTEELGIDLRGFGSWTLKKEEEERGIEPDECYTIGAPGAVPDLAIEVIWTSGGLDKLEIYRRLGVREMWVWKRGDLLLFALRGDHYEPIPKSELLPQIDLDLIRSLLDTPSQLAAVRELRARLRSRG